MARPNSPEDICNLSLDFLKQAPLASIQTPVTTTELIFSRWYDIERQSALRSHPWKFATKRTLLTPDPLTTPPFGYLYAYNLPNDFIRMISIGDDYLRDNRMDHVVENGQILAPSGSSGQFPNTQGQDPTDTQTLYLKYVYDIIAVSSFDSLFIKYLALQLAMSLSTKFAISAALGKNIESMFEDVQTKARSANGQDSPIQRIQQSRILTKRRGLPGGIFASKYTVFDT